MRSRIRVASALLRPIPDVESLPSQRSSSGRPPATTLSASFEGSIDQIVGRLSAASGVTLTPVALGPLRITSPTSAVTSTASEYEGPATWV